MLEFSLPGGGLKGITLTGALIALRERKVIPDIVTGVSAGAYAAYMCYGNLSAEEVVKFFGISRDHFKSRPGLRRVLPPYDKSAHYVTKISEPYLVDHEHFSKNGLKKFLVGYTQWPSFRFVIEDILKSEDKRSAYKSVVKSSTVPFVTNYTLHCDGAIDGGFRKMFFASNESKVNQRVLISFDAYRLINQSVTKKFDRIINLKTSIRSFIRATDDDLKYGFELGYEQGYKLSF